MGENTGIEWTKPPGYRGGTWNPIAAYDVETGRRGWFCIHASDGCRHCYAEALNKHRGNGHAYVARNAGKVRLELVNLDLPLRKRDRYCWFVNSMTDLFLPLHSFAMILEIYDVMAQRTDHIFQVLTKHPDRMLEFFEWMKNFRQLHVQPLPNVWLGVSVEGQKTADARIPPLLQIPAAIRFISAEPLLGPIDLSKRLPPAPGEYLAHEIMLAWGEDTRTLDWVIAGGESGPHARPMHPDWARSLRDQCQAAGVPFFFKQWGEWAPCGNPHHRDRKEAILFPDGTYRVAPTLAEANAALPTGQPDWVIEKIGKRAAGRVLDGRIWNEFPQAAHAQP